MMIESAHAAPLLIFDLDGTLYRTESSFIRTMRRVYEDHGVAHPGDEAILAMVGETFDTLLDWLVPQGFRIGRSELQDEIGRVELEAIRRHGELYDGVPETLRELARRGCALTLCTNGDRRYVDAVMTRGGIGDLMRENPDRLPIMVGDRYHDVAAARANGCTMVGASYGYAREGELTAADACIGSFGELPDIVFRLAGVRRAPRRRA